MTEIQKVILEIYKEVSAICEKHGLRYFAIGGTCLGAVRHKGFIPWDDDMDIAMPIEDYVKFIELCKTELPEHLELFSPDTAPHDMQKIIKVIDNRTMMSSEHFLQWKDTYMGVWVDIMPFPGVPEEGKRRKSFFRKIMYFRRMFCHTKHPFPIEGRFRAKVFWLLVLPLRLTPYNFFWKSWMKFLQSYSFDSEKFTGFVWSMIFDRLIFPKEWFETTVLLPFEDTEMRCPKGYHEYLSQHYGNYMVLPPEEERIPHVTETGIIDLQHSFRDYQNGKLSIPELSKAKK